MMTGFQDMLHLARFIFWRPVIVPSI